MQDKILDIVIKEDELGWQVMLLELVKSENMDPWDIDVSLLAQRFLEIVKELKEMDLKMSGKVFLAAALLLKIKSKRLLNEDISNLDRLFAQSEEGEDGGLLDGLMQEDLYAADREKLKNLGLIPRSPQPRKRKVSIYDLVEALQKALEVKKRRILRNIPEIKIDLDYKKVDISEVIQQVYGKIRLFFLKNSNQRLTFSSLVPDNTKEGKVFTFIPLLHLTNERKVDLHQEQHFGEIEIELAKSSKEVDKELGISAN